MYNFRTDLANERRDIYQKVNGNQGKIDGIESTKEEISENIKVERVKIINENGEKAIGKPIGSYITIDIKNLKIAQREEIEQAANTLTNELKNILDNHIDKKGEILVVGLRKYLCNTGQLGTKGY